ncbi:MAG: RDD family protein [Phycisphaerales bacterium]|nr:RDD family protein [Phycisphaerales bacterium]
MIKPDYLVRLVFSVFALLVCGSSCLTYGAAPTVQATPSLLMAGDGRASLWLSLPTKLTQVPGKTGFILLQHPVNQQGKSSTAWRNITPQPLYGSPVALAAIAGHDNRDHEASTIYAFFSTGQVWAYNADQQKFMPDLPNHLAPAAVAGSQNGIFALTVQPSLPVEGAPKHMQAATGSAEVWRFDGVQWQPLASMPPALANAMAQGTSPSLVYAAGRLWAIWISSSPSTSASPLITSVSVASIAASTNTASWQSSEPLHIKGPVAKLCAVQVEGRLMILWVAPHSSREVTIVGGPLPNSRGDSLKTTFTPIALGPKSIGINVQSSLAIAPDGNAIGLAFSTTDGKLFELAFDRHGRVLSNLKQITAAPASPSDSTTFEHFFIIILALLLALSLWHRNQPGNRSWLVGGLVPAPLTARMLGAMIDVSIPLIAVGLATDMVHADAWQQLGHQATQALVSPELLLHDYRLLWMLAAYLGYLTVTEWLFARSIGKLLLGMKVVDLDGKPPGFLAVFIRNLVRVPELLAPALLLFVILSVDRRRLGDVLAGTVVVGVQGRTMQDTAPHE